MEDKLLSSWIKRCFVYKWLHTYIYIQVPIYIYTSLVVTGEPLLIVALNFCILYDTVFIYVSSDNFGDFIIPWFSQWNTTYGASSADEDSSWRMLLQINYLIKESCIHKERKRGNVLYHKCDREIPSLREK